MVNNYQGASGVAMPSVQLLESVTNFIHQWLAAKKAKRELFLLMNLRSVIERSVEADRTLARLVGQHIDDTAKGLRELKDISTKEEAAGSYQLVGIALGPASFDELNSFKKRLRQRSRPKIPGRGAGMKKADRIQLLLDHEAPMLPSYEQRLRFWYDQSAPCHYCPQPQPRNTK